MTLFENLPFIDGSVACGDRKAISSWWRHQMETFSALLAICAGISPVPGEFPPQRPVKRSFDVFFDLRLNKRLSKQSWGWWFETLSRPLWRQCNVLILHTHTPWIFVRVGEKRRVILNPCPWNCHDWKMITFDTPGTYFISCVLLLKCVFASDLRHKTKTTLIGGMDGGTTSLLSRFYIISVLLPRFRLISVRDCNFS